MEITIDWDAIAAAALGEERDTYSFDLEDVLEAIHKTINRYLPNDEQSIDLRGTETKFEFPFHGRVRKGFIDLWGWEKRGFLWIRDWKTTGSVDERWQWREGNSDQGLFYAHALLYVQRLPIQPVLYECCGVTREGHQKRIDRVFQFEDLWEFDAQAQKWDAAWEQCWKDNNGLSSKWPRNKPEGCRPFGPGYPCQFEEACLRNGTVPILENARVQDLPSSSFSGDKEFRRCPERWRLLAIQRLRGVEREDAPAADWGKAFHRGIAKVYEGLLKQEEQ